MVLWVSQDDRRPRFFEYDIMKYIGLNISTMINCTKIYYFITNATLHRSDT